MKKLYMCQCCLAFYEDRKRAMRCHNMIPILFDILMSKRKNCVDSYRHSYTNKETVQRINKCYYCGKLKKNGKQQHGYVE
jgi:hypothetical protein